MNPVYGVEMKPPKGKLPGFTAQLVKKTAELATVIDRDKQLVIISNKQEARALKDYYISKGVYEECYTLLPLSKVATPTAIFTDYGFISQNHDYYLYNNMVTSFSIKQGEEEEIKMAKLQFEEHLIAQDQNIFYIDQSYIELVEGIARAYGIQLKFMVE
ncbi:hypothetical protein [Pseudalkalibacillus hwajinpoensis]|uniref:Uncharacterized protein n=1 Tax=Guptibacillus hwajinpoensis TaxID=208199 RepID=A0A4U1MGP9_9BACL|nr:hypothetical protein [Pseudalkalibacillus hwajinpoensis]TKD70103.1 hypothetical protein FBF83_12650 [Pseudalkalibacillus hwajinpoensis]